MRAEPKVATWFLRLFCSSSETESVTGDLLEQYHHGRGHLWYWRQVLDIVFLALYARIFRLPLVPARANRISGRQRFAVILGISALSAALLADISIIFRQDVSVFAAYEAGLLQILLVGILGGVIAGLLIFGLRNGREPERLDGPLTDAARIHPGISLSHIPVEGAIGLIFVIATGLIFGIGIPAVRWILAVTLPVGIMGSGILIYWHKHHPVRIQGLDLLKQKRNL